MALFLALTVVGAIIARVLVERDLGRESDRRAEVAAVQVHGRITQAASLTESLRRFMLDARTTGVTSDQFAKNALRWLGPARVSAAAWLEQVPRSRRSAYERRAGHAIVRSDARYGVVPAGSRSAYLPATLATGFPPMAVAGIDLSGAPGMAAALGRATRLGGVVSTPMASPSTGARGLFLVAPAPNLVGGVLRPGYVAVFVTEAGLRAAATGVPAVEVRDAGGSAQGHDDGETSTTSFTTAGQRFTVVVPREPVQGAAAVLPWVILGGGLLVVALGVALMLNAGRRARAQEELDRVFTLSQDLIAVADFDGRFRRVNPAAGEILGYTEEELLARPYIDLVHPADRDSTAAEGAAIAQGKSTVSFENRYLCKDGSIRVLDWTATPDVENGLMYAVARDVTERRRAEALVERLAGEQAALRRAATLVAEEAPAGEVFAKVAEEAATVLGETDCVLLRDEGDGTGSVVGQWGRHAGELRGSRLPIEGDSALMVAIREARPARVDDPSAITGDLGPRAAELGTRSAVACPIVVRGRVWGAIGAFRHADAEPFAADAEERLAQFADLLATAIANADTRDQLTASRARLVTKGDEARRRVVRDLHDGAQQRLVHTVITLKLARRALGENGGKAESLVVEALGHAERANAELRELAHGLLPATLTRGGLRAGVDAVVARLDLPVETDISIERLPAEIEASAYFIVAEALTNVVKHAHATRAEVKASVDDGVLHVQVHDDGLGGADPAGRGLLGLHDRATALGGHLEVESPDRGGTMVTATFPLGSD